MRGAAPALLERPGREMAPEVEAATVRDLEANGGARQGDQNRHAGGAAAAEQVDGAPAMSRVVLFGATGYTGELTARAMAERGMKPVLAGRRGDALARLSGELGGGFEHVEWPPSSPLRRASASPRRPASTGFIPRAAIAWAVSSPV